MRNRELETKTFLKGVTLSQVVETVRKFSQTLDTAVEEIHGSSHDTYYHGTRPRQFARIRQKDGIAQLTVKREDLEEFTDRIEVDILSTDRLDQLQEFMGELLDNPIGEIQKSYWVFDIRGHYGLRNISPYEYSVNGEYQGCVIEVEGWNRASVLAMRDSVLAYLFLNLPGISATESDKSLYGKHFAKGAYPTPPSKL